MSRHNQKVTQLDNDFAKAQLKELAEVKRQAIFRRRRLGVIFALALLIFGFVGFQLLQDYQKVQQLTEIKAEAVADRKLVSANVEKLEKEVQQLNDPDYVEKLARSRFFYSKDGETVYPIPEEDKKAAEEAEAQVEKALADTHASTTAEKQK